MHRMFQVVTSTGTGHGLGQEPRIPPRPDTIKIPNSLTCSLQMTVEGQAVREQHKHLKLFAGFSKSDML
jgi:hypothetical protein